MFGRLDLCDFVLEHPSSSRFHAGSTRARVLRARVPRVSPAEGRNAAACLCAFVLKALPALPRSLEHWEAFPTPASIAPFWVSA